MKKMLAMILMASFTLPAVAAEVTLVCKLSNGKSEAWSFDATAGTVTQPSDEENGNKISTKYKCSDSPDLMKEDSFKTCNEVFIKKTEFGMTRYFNGSYLKTLSISRMDGSYIWGDTTGTCAPFKQAF